jgi:hypothetical protein
LNVEHSGADGRIQLRCLEVGVSEILGYVCHVENRKLVRLQCKGSWGTVVDIQKCINECQKKHHFSAQCSLTNTAAIPMPEPMHMLVTKIRLFVCLAMFSPVAIWRAPAVERKKNNQHSTCRIKYRKTHSCQGDDQWRSHHH